MIQLIKSKIFTKELILLAFLISLALLMHFLFSWAGFNPTDDGLILASSRRILNGEIPYKDFISIRPVGSAFLNLPLVVFAGDYTFWLSRLFTIIEFALISWAWVLIVRKMLELRLSILESMLWGIVIFTFSSHNFPLISSPTIDGLFFISFGFLLCLSKNKILKFLGYFLIGLSCLCKQSFVIIGPLTIIFLQDLLNLQSYAGFLTPAFFYLLYLFLNGALADCILQISSHSDFIKPGIDRYLRDKVFYNGIIVGMIIFFLIYLKKKIHLTKGIINLKELMVIFMIFGTIFYVVNSLSKDYYTYMQSPSFFLFSVVAGMIIFLILYELPHSKLCGIFAESSLSYLLHPWSKLHGFRRGDKKLKNKLNNKLLPLGLFILSLSWTVSLSIGYNSPALATGILVLFLLASEKLTVLIIKNTTLNRLSLILTVIIACLALKNNILGRKNYVYRERPLAFLTKPVDQVISGTKFIKTNENTYRYLIDLKKAIGKAEIRGKNYIIIPELAAYWVKSENRNLLPVDWTSAVEIGNKNSLTRVLKKLDESKGQNLILVQKISTAYLPSGFIPRSEVNEDDEALQYVRANFKKIDKTEFFDIYN